LEGYFTAVKQAGDNAVSDFATTSRDTDPNAPWQERRLVLQALNPIADQWVEALALITPPPAVAAEHQEFVETIDSLMDTLIAGADFSSADAAAAFYLTMGFRDESQHLLEVCRSIQDVADANNVEADMGCEGLFQRLQ
jgi:hypothetical protein